MPGFNEFKQLTDKRLEEAKVLLNAGYPDGCFYLAGYVIEYALKARICKQLEWDNYPADKRFSNFKTHDLDELIMLGGLSKQFDRMKLSVSFDHNWSLINLWDEGVRYNTPGSKLEIEARDTINAIEDTNSGILTWIKSTW